MQVNVDWVGKVYGDRLLLYAVKERQDEETEPEFGFASVSIAACD